MTDRGDGTRQRLLAAAREVVRTSGYSHATTRAIARAAGVTEATIYRHFADKAALFLAAAMVPHEGVIADLAALPDLAGKGDVADNLTAALVRLSTLRDDFVPLELAFHADPELWEARAAAVGAAGTQLSGPPEFVVAYLAAEQRLGRVRPDVDPALVAKTLLGLLLVLGLDPVRDRAEPVSAQAVAEAVGLLVRGLMPGADTATKAATEAATEAGAGT